jgi:hypothetical protein
LSKKIELEGLKLSKSRARRGAPGCPYAGQLLVFLAVTSYLWRFVVGTVGFVRFFYRYPCKILGWDLTDFNYLFNFFSEFLYDNMSSMVVTCGADGIC